jgi:Ca-activated chloride channel family protein
MRNRPLLPMIVLTAVVLAACGSSTSLTTWAPDNGGTTWSGTPTTTPAFEETTTTVYQDYPYPDVAFPDQDFNPPVDADWDGVSTFALDVDTGSYSIARKFVLDGYLPDPDSIRVEEFVNYFQQDYTQPRWADGLAVTIDGSTTPFLSSPFDRIIRVGIQSAELPEELRRHAALTFVIDTSGSMEEGRRLELVKESLRMLVDELQPTDTVAVVAYNSNADVILGPTAIEDRNSILDAINSLRAGGSTNAEAGLALGYRLAADAYREGAINRVVLASDGVANVGTTDPEGILRLIADDAARGINLVTVGVGMGNYNDVLLEQLADQGDGFYAYVDDLDEAHRIFVQDLTATLQTAAQDARVQVEFNPEVVQSYRLIGFENRAMADQEFRNDYADAGEIGAGHTVTALYEVRLHEQYPSGTMGVVRLRWLHPESGEAREFEQFFGSENLYEGFEWASPRFQQDVFVARYAELLRFNSWDQSLALSLEDLVSRAAALRGDLDDDSFNEFVELVDRAWKIAR